jgi:molybdopterin-guanine dinucleotide biosynthesis adapter protein
MSISNVFGIYGESDSGKTTLIVQLVTRLTTEGYQVATVKQTNKAISMDMKEKDTWRHHQAGAPLVVFSSRKETNFLFNTSLHMSEILQRISYFGSFDYIFVEGADDPKIPKIRVGSGKKRTNTIATYKDNFHEILGLLKKTGLKPQNVPDLSIRVNGKDVPLTEFPKRIISNVVVSLVESLKGVNDVRSVTLELQR